MNFVRFCKFFVREWLLSLYALLFLLLMIFYHPSIRTLFSVLDVRACLSIFGFLVVLQGLRDTGFLRWLANRIAERSSNARQFALAMVAGTAFLAVFVTNDLALFTFVPIVIAAPVRRDLKFRMLVLLALAANVGAFLSPVGNPQKILLWQASSTDVQHFLKPFMLPFALLIMGLFSYTAVLVPPVPISVEGSPIVLDRNVVYENTLVFSGYLMLLFLGLWWIGVFLAVCYFIWRHPGVFRRMDWAFVALILLLFMDFGILSRYFDISKFFSEKVLSSEKGAFLVSVLLTQFLSDVATAILLEHYSSQYVAIAMGATVGALGLVIASVANIISVRLSTERRKYLRFHKYSLPFFIFALTVVWLTMSV